MQTKTIVLSRLVFLAVLGLSEVVAAAELVIPGSGNPEYVLGVLAADFNARQKEHRVAVPPTSGTAGGIRDVLAGTAVLGRVGRSLTDEEKAKGLTYLPMGRDAVVFVAGAGVTVKAVTTAQMTAAFAGKYSDWRELGGKPGPIRAVGREASDASRMAMSARNPAFKDLIYGSAVKIVHLDSHTLFLLDRFETSLGLLNRSALQAAKTKLVILTLDRAEPTTENLVSGRYPIWLEFGLIHKTGATLPAEAGAFMKFLQSPEGTRILRAHGIAPPGGKS